MTNTEAFDKCLAEYRRCEKRFSFSPTTNEREAFRATFHAAGLRCLPRHLYEVFSFSFLHDTADDVVVRRLSLSDRQIIGWKNDIREFVGREILSCYTRLGQFHEAIGVEVVTNG